MENGGKKPKAQLYIANKSTHFNFKDIHRLQVKRQEKTLHANISRNQKTAGVAILSL